MARHGSLRLKVVCTSLIAVIGATCGGGDDGGGSPTGPSPAPTGPATTITVTNDGASPSVVDISPGQRVEFVNAGSRTFQIFSTPHGSHTDCPAINDVSDIAPGQRKMTGALTATRICGFHDHRNPSSDAHRGTIRVGTTEGPAPEY